MTPLTFAALSTVVAESFRAGVTSRVFCGGNSAKAASVNRRQGENRHVGRGARPHLADGGQDNGQNHEEQFCASVMGDKRSWGSLL